MANATTLGPNYASTGDATVKKINTNDFAIQWSSTHAQ